MHRCFMRKLRYVSQFSHVIDQLETTTTVCPRKSGPDKWSAANKFCFEEGSYSYNFFVRKKKCILKLRMSNLINWIISVCHNF